MHYSGKSVSKVHCGNVVNLPYLYSINNFFDFSISNTNLCFIMT